MRLEIHYGGYDIHVEDANVEFSVKVVGECEEIRLLVNTAETDLEGLTGDFVDIFEG